MTVTPSSSYDVFSLTDILDASDLVVELIAAPTETVSYSVLVGTAAYTGVITVEVKDVNGNSVYSGTM